VAETPAGPETAIEEGMELEAVEGERQPLYPAGQQLSSRVDGTPDGSHSGRATPEQVQAPDQKPGSAGTAVVATAAGSAATAAPPHHSRDGSGSQAPGSASPHLSFRQQARGVIREIWWVLRIPTFVIIVVQVRAGGAY